MIAVLAVALTASCLTIPAHVIEAPAPTARNVTLNFTADDPAVTRKTKKRAAFRGRTGPRTTVVVDGEFETSDTLSRLPDRGPVPGPALVETRALDPRFCLPGAPQAFATAYIQLCLDPVEDCPDGQVLQPARESRSRPAGTADWGPWEPLSAATCVTPGEDDLIDDVRTAFAQMTITPPPVTVIDGRGWTFVQIDTIVYSDDQPQTLAATAGGTPVEIRATPVEWHWDFGDKTKPLTTTTPGGPYPDKTVSHVYTHLGTYQVTLTTTWQGQWRLVGETAWRDVDGQNVTTSTSEPFTTHEIRTRLVTPPR